YVAARVTELSQVLAKLSNRASSLGHPVRVLLLERRADAWLSAVSGTGGDKYLINEKKYREAPTMLNGLTVDARWKIVQEAFRAHEAADIPDRELVLATLDKLDPAGRPLFVILFSELLATRSGRTNQFSDVTTVVHDLLERETTVFWH